MKLPEWFYVEYKLWRFTTMFYNRHFWGLYCKVIITVASLTIKTLLVAYVLILPLCYIDTHLNDSASSPLSRSHVTVYIYRSNKISHVNTHHKSCCIYVLLRLFTKVCVSSSAFTLCINFTHISYIHPLITLARHHLYLLVMIPRIWPLILCVENTANSMYF